MKHYDKLKKLENKHGEVEYSAEVPQSVMEAYADSAFSERVKELELPGFRKGKVPEEMARKYVHEMDLWEDAADAALREAVSEIMEDEKLTILGGPQVNVTKIAPKNPLEFKIRFALFPEVELPDYKKIGKTISERKDSAEISEKEIDEALERIRKMMAGPAAEGQEQKLPEVTDELAGSLGPFKSVAELRTELKRQLTQEKEWSQKEAKRDEIVKEIMEKSRVLVPALFVEQEMERLRARRGEELKAAGLSQEQYLAELKKTLEELEKDERQVIENRTKMSLVLGKIREDEKVQPDAREVEIGILQLKQRFPDRDEHSLRHTAENMSLQEKLFEMLEGKEEPEPEKK